MENEDSNQVPKNLPDYVEVLSLLENFKTETHPTNKSTIYTGYIDGLEKYDTFLALLKEIGYPYSVRNSDAAISKKVFYSSNFGVINIPFFGSPFIIEKSSIQDCVCGKLYFKRSGIVASTKEEYLEKKAQLHKDGITNKRILSPPKRINCPAFLYTRCIRIFQQDDYKTDEQTASNWRKSKHIRKKLSADLLKPDPPVSTRRFFVALSAFKEHNHDPLPPKPKKTPRVKKNNSSENDYLTTFKQEDNKKRKNDNIDDIDCKEIINVVADTATGGEDNTEKTNDNPSGGVIQIGKRRKVQKLTAVTEVRKSPRKQNIEKSGAAITPCVPKTEKGNIKKESLHENSIVAISRKRKVNSDDRENPNIVIIRKAPKVKQARTESSSQEFIGNLDNVEVVNVQELPDVEVERTEAGEMWIPNMKFVNVQDLSETETERQSEEHGMWLRNVQYGNFEEPSEAESEKSEEHRRCLGNMKVVDVEEPSEFEEERTDEDEAWTFHIVETETSDEPAEQLVEEMTVDAEESQLITDLMRDTAVRIAQLTDLCDNTDPVLIEYYSALIKLEEQVRAHCHQHQSRNHEQVTI